MMLRVVITWPDDTPISREDMAEILGQVTYIPDGSTTAPLGRGDEAAEEYPNGVFVDWIVT